MKPIAIGLVALIVVSACRPRLSPLVGAEAPAARLPRTALTPGRHKLVFDWRLDDRDMVGRGDGAARIAAPDSARLDFYLAGGIGYGAAVLIADSLRFPPGVVGGDMIRRLVPPPPLLWAVLGRVALPNLPDTVIRIEGSTLRADVGTPVAWRLTFRGDTLFRAEHVEGGRIAEWVERSDATHAQYRNEGSRRSLQITVTRTEEASEFDASIWRFDR